MAKTGSISISYKQNIDANKSDITVSGIITTSGESYRGSHRTGTYTIKRGSTVIASGSFTSGAPANSTTTLFTKTVTVNHNADGSYGTITASYTYDIGSGSSYWNLSASASKAIPTIPRVSVPTLNGSLFTVTKNNSNFMRIYTNRKSTNFTHHIYYSINGSSETGIISNVADYYDWYFPNSVANLFTNAERVNGYIRLYTFNGSTNLGSKTVGFQITVGGDIVPTLTSISCSEAVSDVASLIGAYVQNKSRLNLSINGAAGIYGSTIKSYKITVGDQTVNSSSGTTGVITKSGNLPITATITDSRGRTATKTSSIYVYPYASPYFRNIDITRDDTSATIKANGTCSSLIINDQEKNEFKFRIRVKKKSSTVWEDKSVTATGVIGYTLSATVTGLEAKSSYDVQLFAMDKITESSPYELAVSTAVVFMDKDVKNSRLGLGKMLEYDDSTLEMLENAVLYVGEKKIPLKNIVDISQLNNYLPLSGGTVNGDVYFNSKVVLRNSNASVTPAKPMCSISQSGNMLQITSRNADGSYYKSYLDIHLDTSHVNIPTQYGSIGYTRFDPNGIGFFGSNEDARILQNRKGWVGHGGTTEMRMQNEAGNILCLSANGVSIVAELLGTGSTSNGLRMTAAATDKVNLGFSTARWLQVYAKNTGISTSDRNKKKNFKELNDLYYELAKKIEIISYQFKDTEQPDNVGRTHIGSIAQQVEEAMEELGMTSKDFAGFCKDLKQKVEVDDNGKEIFTPIEGEYDYSLRYDEIEMLKLWYLEETNRRQQHEIDLLKEDIAKLKGEKL